MIAVARLRRKKQGGHVMIEMGLSMIVLFVIIFGIIEYSQLMYAWNFCSYAAQAGARYASVRGATFPTACANASSSNCYATQASVTSYVQSLAVALNSSQLTVTTSWSPNENQGSNVTVQVNYVDNPLLTIVLPHAMTLSSTAQMPILQ
jgi:Flp pilus assembly protein TadG